MYQILQLNQPQTYKRTDLSILSDTTVRRSTVDGRPKTILGIKKLATFLQVIKKLTSFSKTLPTTKRRLTGGSYLFIYLSPTFINKGTTDMIPSNNLKNKIPSEILCTHIMLVCMKVQIHISLEPPLEYNQDQIQN